MKRYLSILFASLLALSLLLSSCGKTGQESSGESKSENEETSGTEKQEASCFRVGYGFTDIMPDENMPLDSYGNAEQRVMTGFLNKIYFTAIAITDENDKTLLLMTYDITQAHAPLVADLRSYAQETYGIDPEYVHLSGTHTHSSVALGVNWPSVGRYKSKLFQRAREAVDLAMADRKPAEMYYGETKTHGLNFVRHYWRADGTSTGDNHGYFSDAPVVSHIGEPDESMRLLKFTRTNEDGTAAKDVVIANWQAHNHLTGGMKKYDLAADFSGAFRSCMEKDKNCLFAFFQGCAGNLNELDNRLTENTITKDYREYGQLLANTAEEIYDSMTKIETGPVKAITRTFESDVNHTRDHLIGAAQEIRTAWTNANYDNNVAYDMGEQYGINSAYEAAAIIKNAKAAPTFTVDVNAYCIGDIAFTSVPLEMFDKTGMAIREASPFTMTITQGYTDASHGYIPTKEAYEYGCYEADTTIWAPGAAEKLCEQLVSMLNELHE